MLWLSTLCLLRDRLPRIKPSGIYQDRLISMIKHKIACSAGWCIICNKSISQKPVVSNEKLLEPLGTLIFAQSLLSKFIMLRFYEFFCTTRTLAVKLVQQIIFNKTVLYFSPYLITIYSNYQAEVSVRKKYSKLVGPKNKLDMIK